MEHIKDAITTLKLGYQRPDKRRILKHVHRSAAANVDQDYIAQILQDMLRSNLIQNRPTESEPSYYITDQNCDSSVDANNTDNPECMSDNDSDEQTFFNTIVTPKSKLDK